MIKNTSEVLLENLADVTGGLSSSFYTINAPHIILVFYFLLKIYSAIKTCVFFK